MEEEGATESIATSAVNTANETGKLVEVKFDKKPYRIQKYLEAEPKALGVTQIMLNIFFFSTMGVTLNNLHYDALIICIISSSISIIAGSVAIAAQNLHLPTLKACLGMQVLACVLSVLCSMLSIEIFTDLPFFFHYCWNDYYNSTYQTSMCERLWAIDENLIGLQLLMHMTQIAVSATLAGFCCKVIQCCSPRDNVPVIVVNAPPGPL